MAERERRYVTLDVFTRTRREGNPLAVMLDGAGLDDVAMQSIAREFNLPETVFVSPPRDAANTAAMRIFTPAVELPFAGHPTVGTAVLLGCQSGKREILLEQKLGLVRCVVNADGAEAGHARFAIPKLPERVSDAPPHGEIAPALGLKSSDIGFCGFEAARWSAGVAFYCVPLAGLDAMARAKPAGEAFDRAFGGDAPARAYLFCAAKNADYRARMFAPAMGIPEDPATGSAAAALAGMLAAQREDGEHAIVIEQGIEMGRASRIELDLSIQSQRLTAASIGGHAIIVSEGTMRV